MNLRGNEVTMRRANHSVSASDVQSLKARLFSAGTVIFPKVGAAIATNKKRILASEALIDNNVMGVSVDESQCLPEYLYFWLLTVDLTTISARGPLPSISAGNAAKLQIPLPSIDEQKRIVRILSTTQRASEAIKNVLSAAAALKRATENESFRELSAPRFRLGDLLVQRQYGMSVRGNPTGKWPLLRMTNVANGSVHFDGLQFVDISDAAARPYIVADGDLLFNRTNSPSLVGRTGLVRNPPAAVFASYLIRLRPDEDRLLPEYLNRYLNWEPVQQHIRAMAARGVSQANVSASKLAELEILVPPLDQQMKIARIIERVQAKASAEHLCAGRITHCFESVLDRLLGEAA